LVVTRTRLPRLGPAYEEILQDIFAIGSGEQLFAIFAMQRPIAGAGFRLHAHDLIACLAPGTDEIGGIVFDHTKAAYIHSSAGISFRTKARCREAANACFENPGCLKDWHAEIGIPLPIMGLRVIYFAFP
jgi:hypothetical protein